LGKMAKTSVKSVSMRLTSWECVDEIMAKCKGSFRSRSHIIEHLLNNKQTLEELLGEVRGEWSG